MDFLLFAELAINGSMAGLMYSLVALGIVIIYKSSSVPNLAQGAMTMLGAYVVLAIANGFGLSMWAAIPLAMGTMFFVGMGIERVALRRLAGRPVVMILMMTLGLDIFIRATSLAVWGGSVRPLSIGISNDPLFLGPLLLNRTYAVGVHGGRRAVFDFHVLLSHAQGSSCCAPSPTAISRRGLSVFRSSVGWHFHGPWLHFWPPQRACYGDPCRVSISHCHCCCLKVLPSRCSGVLTA